MGKKQKAMDNEKIWKRIGELLGIFIDTGTPGNASDFICSNPFLIPVLFSSLRAQQAIKTKSQSDRKFALVNLHLLLLGSSVAATSWPVVNIFNLRFAVNLRFCIFFFFFLSRPFNTSLLVRLRVFLLITFFSAAAETENKNSRFWESF